LIPYWHFLLPLISMPLSLGNLYLSFKVFEFTTKKGWGFWKPIGGVLAVDALILLAFWGLA
jgi:hypothetical protein